MSKLAALSFLTPEEKREFDELMALDAKRIWRPLPGPQRQAYESQADITGYGGAAGGGKTDLACGLALTTHCKSMIMRRESPQLQGVFDRLTTLLGSRDGFASQDKIWRLKGRQIEFGSTPNLEDELKYQGRPHDLLVFDEATNFLESQVRFLLGWLRTDDPTQRCRALLTFNPPTTSEGRWVITYFAPWLNDKHPNPAKPGELRWFATIEGEDREVETDAPFVLVDDQPVYDFDETEFKPEEIIKPLSRTFIPSRVSDNPHYMRTGYLATLQGLPEPLRSQMLNGDFLAGVEDDPWQVIPTEWVDLAMSRWQRYETLKGLMDSMGVDVARSGKDQTVIARRHGTWFDELVCYPGKETPDGPTILAHILTARRDQAPVHIDVIGVGSSPYDFLVQNRIQTVGIDYRNATSEMNQERTMGFYNLRAECWWKMREALDPMNLSCISLPPDQKLRADLCAPLWKPTTRGVLVESKEDTKDRIKRSPDRADAACMALRVTPKQGAVRERSRAKPSSAWAA